MQINVLLFAALREAAGSSQLTLTVENDARGDAVIDALARLLPDRRPLLDRCALAVNEVYTAGTVELRDGDTVAVIPPVSGG
jgi:molybdopterin synthase sulfur carrier subunit